MGHKRIVDIDISAEPQDLGFTKAQALYLRRNFDLLRTILEDYPRLCFVHIDQENQTDTIPLGYSQITNWSVDNYKNFDVSIANEFTTIYEGRYLFSGPIYAEGDASTNYFYEVRVNGIATEFVGPSLRPSGGGGAIREYIHAILDLDLGDTVTLWVNSDSASATHDIISAHLLMKTFGELPE
jgi:hypothetical protein